MALDAASIATYKAFIPNWDDVVAAIAKPETVAMPFVPKPGEIKIGDATFHVYDTSGHDGLKGRVKQEVLTQATELGVKAVAAAFEVDYKGNDPVKLKEAVVAKLNIPIADQIKEKERDIATMTDNWNKAKAEREAIAARLKDREDTDRDVSFFPENRIKSVKDKTLRNELKDDGITIGEHETEIGGAKVMRPAVFVNGVPQKAADLSLVDPKVFISEHFKNKGWIAEPAAAAAPGKKQSFDTASGGAQGKSAFDDKGTYERILAANGGAWTEKANAEYTNAIVNHNRPAPAPAAQA
jgi:hypothetical protein